ncbi:hypothetical protein ACWPKS_15775 [Coraliomargarita sp. W4R72]
MEDQLSMFQTAKDAPEVEQLIKLLDGRGWLTASQLAQATGHNDRKVRSIASATPKILSYPGSPGYKLTRQATPEEIESAITLKTQGQTMIARYVSLLNEFRFGTGTIKDPTTSTYANGQ